MQRKKRGIRHQPTQNALAFYLNTLLYMLLVSLLYFASFAPLLALIFAETGSALRYLALLCPVLVIFVLLPMRFSFAQAMAARCHREAFSIRKAFGFSLYGEKLAEGVLYALHLIKWAIPLAASIIVLYYLYLNAEAFALIKSISDMGAAMTAVWGGFVNFVVGIFGRSVEFAAGGITEGLFMIAGIVGLCVLFFFWGVSRNSASRYIWAEATELDKNPHAEARRSLRGRRFQQMGISLINLALLLLPLALLYVLIEPKQTIEALATQYADALVSQSALPAIAVPYGKLALAFFAVYLPLLPLRRMMTAFFATSRFRRSSLAPDFSAVNGDITGQMPLLYEDKPAASGRKQ